MVAANLMLPHPVTAGLLLTTGYTNTEHWWSLVGACMENVIAEMW